MSANVVPDTAAEKAPPEFWYSFELVRVSVRTAWAGACLGARVGAGSPDVGLCGLHAASPLPRVARALVAERSGNGLSLRRGVLRLGLSAPPPGLSR